MASVCPRCTTLRDQREGPYFVCVECRWRWTMSVTGKVYVQDDWTPAGAIVPRADSGVRRLLKSVDGLSDKLASAWPAGESPAAPGFGSTEDIERLRRVRDAAAAGYFNDGLPLETLRTEGVPPPPDDDDDEEEEEDV